MFGTVVLLDMSNGVLVNPRLDHKKLDYTFIQKELTSDYADYVAILERYHIDIVLDLTDADSLPILEATNKAHVSYVNACMNNDDQSCLELIRDIYDRKEVLTGAPHILCTGMNPGVVNMWVQYGIEKYGVPREVIHFEYDTSTAREKWMPTITWSIHEFLVEAVSSPSGIMLGRDQLRELFPNGLKHRMDMEPLLSPIMKLDAYPQGLIILHDENVSIAQKYDIPSQFIYAIHMKTMDYMDDIYSRKHHVSHADLVHGDNILIPINGSDNIGVILDYDDKKVYYFNSALNFAANGTNGTCMQVIVGVYAALFTLLIENLPSKAYFVEDLSDTVFKPYVFEHMDVSEYIFQKHGTVLSLEKHIPKIVAEKSRVHLLMNKRL
ncbi:MAG TPA: hypothetical protein VHV10_02675 [Ktedonobacteraceae bacterium]|nr:hypothetical protein [Ktedonobacteraceae bacterium]